MLETHLLAPYTPSQKHGRASNYGVRFLRRLDAFSFAVEQATAQTKNIAQYNSVQKIQYIRQHFELTKINLAYRSTSAHWICVDEMLLARDRFAAITARIYNWTGFTR